MKHVAVLLSGMGTNLQAIIDASQQREAGYDVTLVLSNRRKAGGLAKAEAAGIPGRYVDARPFDTREDYDRELAALIDSAAPSLIVLAGFMRILSPYFVRRYAGRIINIHPSLLPQFPGKDPQAQALAAGATRTGVTVHFVDEGVDTGCIIAQEPVEIVAGETVESLTGKIQRVEHALYPKVIANICAEMNETHTGLVGAGGSR